MPVAKITEISATSKESFDDALNAGIKRANKTLNNVKSVWIKDQQADIENGKIAQYKVLLKVTFVLED
ncbi:MAG: dodecin family protein [Desulfuromusa sp.]|nr:dodecin family protein [Desulfuromusa sp.]